MAAKGGSAVTLILTNQEYRVELVKKLQEEVNEFLEDQCTEELADILEVIHALAPIVAGNLANLEQVRLAKLQESGGYDKQMFVIEIHDK